MFFIVAALVLIAIIVGIRESKKMQRPDGVECGHYYFEWNCSSGGEYKVHHTITAINKKKQTFLNEDNLENSLNDIVGWNGFSWELERGINDKKIAFRKKTKGKDWEKCSK